MKYGMVIDTLKCVGCSDCVVACQTENKIPIGFCRDWVTQSVEGKYPKVNIEFKSQRCNHCENAPCVYVCPTGASHYEEGGIVKVTEHKCIGCGACIQSCPYNARYNHPEGYVDKCTFCSGRVKEGLSTACASVCPARCIWFGDLSDPQSYVSNLLRKRKHKALKTEMGTEPKIFYLT